MIFLFVVWFAIAAFVACVLRVICSTWRHTGIALVWPLHAVLGLVMMIGHALVFIGDRTTKHTARAGGALTRWLP